MIKAHFHRQLAMTVHQHPIVLHNPYTSWFARGDLTKEEVARFTREFSVFSHHFLIAQMHKVLEAPDVETYRAGKEILLNELGVAFRNPDMPPAGESPDVASATGTVDGGTYRHASAHFEWLVDFAKPLGLGFSDLGRRNLASPTTGSFCDDLIALYGSANPQVAAGASYAIEHWAAAGFWKELIQGLRDFRDASGIPLNLGFWVFHDKLEQQHADHTDDELAALEAVPGFVPEEFLRGAHLLLDAVQRFWEGLADGRILDSRMAPKNGAASNALV